LNHRRCCAALPSATTSSSIQLELEFAAGFGALTGETGAGKSILVDALSLALGERADAGLGAQRLREGRDSPPSSPWRQAARWPPGCAPTISTTDACLLRRVIDAGGRSRGYINGVPATLTQLREAADFLADIHGQHAHHSLLRSDALDLDPQRLAELDARIDAVTQMARKHRVTPEELPALRESLQARLAELVLRADPEALAERERAAETHYRGQAKKLTALRSKAAKALSAAVTGGMQNLAMAGGRFEIALTALPEGSAGGDQSIEFLVAANAGQDLRPLAKVASGGELSRIGLALQVIASQANTAGTLIFDEVDVGIGGRVAEIVGRMLRELGKSRQVLCVTHLPQVAAQADWQWSIAKNTRDGKTTSAVLVLDAEARIGEIARMLGGEKITETTRRHAAEMLGRS
jgi:DNA repair protein RecN (Recombination protein N)